MHSQLSQDSDKRNKNNIFIAGTGDLLNNAHAVFSQQEESYKMKTTVLKASAILLTLGLATGCANTDEIQATADQAAADAAAAASAAEAARAAADRASQAAANAQSTADRALSAANGAQACCDANKEAMERMFQRSMSK